MGIYTDSILVEIEARLADVENIIYADENGEIASSFLDLLKKKLARCSKLLHDSFHCCYGYSWFLWSTNWISFSN